MNKIENQKHQTNQNSNNFSYQESDFFNQLQDKDFFNKLQANEKKKGKKARGKGHGWTKFAIFLSISCFFVVLYFFFY